MNLTKHGSPSNSKTATSQSIANSVVSITIGTTVIDGSASDLSNPKWVADVQKRSKTKKTIRVQIRKFLSLSDPIRLQVISFVSGFKNAKIKIDLHPEANGLLHAILSTIKSGMSLGQRHTAKVAALEATVLQSPTALGFACRLIAGKFKEIGVDDMTTGNLMDEAARIAESLVEGNRPRSADESGKSLEVAAVSDEPAVPPGSSLTMEGTRSLNATGGSALVNGTAAHVVHSESQVGGDTCPSDDRGGAELSTVANRHNKTVNKIFDVKIAEIVIGKRFRVNMGNVESLAQSIDGIGLLQPIGLTPDYEMVFGERRRQACLLLGRETIAARIVDVKSVMRGQIEENELRKDFTVTERTAIVDAHRSFEHGGDRRSDQVRSSEVENLPIEAVCQRAGLSKDSYYRAKEVIDQGVPDLVEAMDRGDLSIAAAATLAKASADDQQEFLGNGIDGEKATARTIKKSLAEIRNKREHAAQTAKAVEASDTNDAIQIYHCRFQDLETTSEIAPNSVNAIITDPPYSQEFLTELPALGEFAARVLVDGGLFVTYYGQMWLHRLFEILGKSLTYRWMNASVWDGAAVRVQPGGWKQSHARVLNRWKPVVVFSKGDFTMQGQWTDVSHVLEKEKDLREWQQPLAEIEKLIRDFSNPGDLVVDPCGGSFTTAVACLQNNRRFIGCDIDHAAVVTGQERLARNAAPVSSPSEKPNASTRSPIEITRTEKHSNQIPTESSDRPTINSN